MAPWSSEAAAGVPPARAGARGERGQALPLLAVAVVLVGLLGIGAVRLGFVEVARARAQAAADAAALAGAAHDRPAATRLAEADGGRLVRFERLGTDVLVTVEVGGERASARARAVRDPPPAAPGGGPQPQPVRPAATSGTP